MIPQTPNSKRVQALIKEISANEYSINMPEIRNDERQKHIKK